MKNIDSKFKFVSISDLVFCKKYQFDLCWPMLIYADVMTYRCPIKVVVNKF